MKSERRKQVRRLAEQIREALKLSVPVDIEKAVMLLGGRINRPSLEDGTPEASVKRIENSAPELQFEINVQDGSSDQRYRFSVAHEIGHLFLHMGFLTEAWDQADEYKDSVMYRFGYSTEEIEAHEFAGAFLIPEGEFKARIDIEAEGGRVNLEAIADHFNVSKPAARARGRYLGILD